MALVSVSVPTKAPATIAAAAAPTTSEVIADPGDDVILEVIAGGTAVTVTVVRPGNLDAGDAVQDLVIGPLTSTSRAIRIGKEYGDPAATPTGAATVQFSSVATTTARLWRV